MRIIFAGTPDFAAAHLKALIDNAFDVVAVYTQPDRPAGRGKKLTPSATKTLALAHDIRVEQPPSLKTPEALDTLKAFEADLMVVVAYGLILPLTVLQTPTKGCINVHGSLLPKWRGAAPIQRAVWAGDDRTGVSIMQMDEGLDTGDVLLEREIPISASDTSAEVYSKLATIGPQTLVDTLHQFDTLRPIPQDNTQATYAKKLSKAEAKCDWGLDVCQLERNVRAFNPWPVVWFEHKNETIKVWDAVAVSKGHNEAAGTVINYSAKGLEIACQQGSLLITKLQLAGKRAQAVSELIHGRPELFSAGERLS